MGRNLYIADWHYGHGNCIRFDNRPYNSVEEMNTDLIERWNLAVHPDDTCYILGDMFWIKGKDAIPVLELLNGNKVLVKGNHDRCNDGEFKSCFTKIDEYIEVEDNGRRVVLCHYPIPCFKNHYYGWFHLYGHVHSGFEWNMMESVKREMVALYDTPCNMYNVGCMMPYIDYMPRTLDEIISGYDAWANSREATQ